MEAIHRLIAYGAIPLIVTGIGVSILLVAARRAGGAAFDRFQAAVVSVLFVGSVSGAVLFASGMRPTDGLHLLYAAVALATVPLARSFTGRSGGLGTAALLLAAFVVLGALLFRLITTG
jgi:uncharacterized MAPEG superfamily protein